jgi:LPPG:FO 2-phospho-L-lactate transferase
MRVTLLAGGTGGTKLAHGFTMLPDVELTVVANVGDDTEVHGLLVCPDVDALLYTLGGLIDVDRGWGVAGDTLTAHGMFERYGGETWFTVGDADLATHVERARLMREGASLTGAVAAMARALGIAARLLPASDDPWRTVVETDDGPRPFQEYFVRQRQEPDVRGIRYDGDARPTDEAIEAIEAADLVVIGPSNPIVSIGPIRVLPGVDDALRAARAPRVAVSPIIAGRALKGPADRMLASLGHEVSAVGVARLYAGLLDRFVIDETDAALGPSIAELGMEPVILPTVMRTDADRAALAAAIVQGSA